MKECCNIEVEFDGVSVAYRRALLAVIAINAIMAIVEMSSGYIADSQALKADALDFMADTLTYGISLLVIGYAPVWRARAALLKGASLAVLGLWILGSSAYQIFADHLPQAQIMGSVGMLALAANLACLVILLKYRQGDANVRSVWLCTRNDSIGNIAVVAAASGVWTTQSIYPDLLVAAGLASLFLWSSLQILQQARQELRQIELRA